MVAKLKMWRLKISNVWVASLLAGLGNMSLVVVMLIAQK